MLPEKIGTLTADVSKRLLGLRRRGRKLNEKHNFLLNKSLTLKVNQLQWTQVFDVHQIKKYKRICSTVDSLRQNPSQNIFEDMVPHGSVTRGGKLNKEVAKQIRKIALQRSTHSSPIKNSSFANSTTNSTSKKRGRPPGSLNKHKHAKARNETSSNSSDVNARTNGKRNRKLPNRLNDCITDLPLSDEHVPKKRTGYIKKESVVISNLLPEHNLHKKSTTTVVDEIMEKTRIDSFVREIPEYITQIMKTGLKVIENEDDYSVISSRTLILYSICQLKNLRIILIKDISLRNGKYHVKVDEIKGEPRIAEPHDQKSDLEQLEEITKRKVVIPSVEEVLKMYELPPDQNEISTDGFTNVVASSSNVDAISKDVYNIKSVPSTIRKLYTGNNSRPTILSKTLPRTSSINGSGNTNNVTNVENSMRNEVFITGPMTASKILETKKRTEAINTSSFDGTTGGNNTFINLSFPQQRPFFRRFANMTHGSPRMNVNSVFRNGNLPQTPVNCQFMPSTLYKQFNEIKASSSTNNVVVPSSEQRTIHRQFMPSMASHALRPIRAVSTVQQAISLSSVSVAPVLSSSSPFPVRPYTVPSVTSSTTVSKSSWQVSK